MPEPTEVELVKQAEEYEAKRVALTQFARLTDTTGQMQSNIARMEREGTTNAPALDQKSPANAGKTQYEIDQAILAQKAGERDALVAANSKFFTVEESERRSYEY